jgi:hypothetical protein
LRKGGPLDEQEQLEEIFYSRGTCFQLRPTLC